MDLNKLIYNINDKGYKRIKLYTEDNDKVRFILVSSSIPFMLNIPNTINMSVTEKYKDLVENNFDLNLVPKPLSRSKTSINLTSGAASVKSSKKSKIINPQEPKVSGALLQETFLNNIKTSEWSKIKGIGGPGYIPGICCLTDTNICLKVSFLAQPGNGNLSTEKLTSAILYNDVYFNYSSSNSVLEVGSVYPVFNILYFVSCKQDIFQSVLTEIVADIVRQEEEFNELSSEMVINSLEEMRKQIKEKLYNINKSSFNTHRDIIKNTEALDKLGKLKLESVDKKDSIRFNIERLITETENTIEELYEKLAKERNEINKIMRKYSGYLGKLRV